MSKTVKRIIGRILLLFLIWILIKNTIFNLYIWRHNRSALLKIKEINDAHYAIFSAFLKDIESNTDWHPYITSGYRTEAEQARLKKQDARNARPGQSKHNHAKAIDIVLYQNTGLWQQWIVKSSRKERWLGTRVLDIAKKHQLRWGGNFSNYYDPVHFEIE